MILSSGINRPPGSNSGSGVVRFSALRASLLTASIKLIPGDYRIVAVVNDETASVKPFSGVKTLKKGHQADTRFIIY